MASVLLLCAMQTELLPVIRRLRLSPAADRFTGRVGPHDVTAMQTGVGPDRAVASARRCISESNFDRLIFYGIAGGLSPNLDAATVYQATILCNEQGQRVELCHADHPVTFLTVAEPAASVEHKQRLREQTGADLVDTESFPVAQLAGRHDLPATFLRAISDDANTALPADAVNWVAADGSPRVGAVLRSLLRRPWLLPRLVGLARRSAAAGNRLAEDIERRLHALPAGTGAEHGLP